MPEILIPFTFDDLPIRPPLEGRPKVSDDIQQTMAVLVGWDKTTRRLVSVSPTGVLHVASPPVKGILNILSTATGFTWSGDDIPTSEVLIKAHATNANRVWINVGAAAASSVGYPLEAESWVNLSLNNLSALHLFFDADTEKAIIIYTK